MNLYEVSSLVIGYFIVAGTGIWVGRKDPKPFSGDWWLATCLFGIGFYVLIITGV